VISSTEPGSLKGYWKCNETSGAVLADSSGNGRDLTISGVIGLNYFLGESGEQGACFRTDGVAGFASRNDAVIPSLDNTNFTLFALFKGGTHFGVNKALAVTNFAAKTSLACIGQNKLSRRARAQARGNSSVMRTPIVGAVAFDGNWHSLTFRRSGNVFTLFVDGANGISITARLAAASVCNRTSIMHPIMGEVTAYAKGSVQHAAIWNTALSDTEIAAIQTARQR
jgi:hypothetical protein